MTKQTSKFTASMEQRIRDSAPLNQEISRALAAEFNVDGVTERSVTAKAVRMGVEYIRKQATTKTGAPVERKEAIVAQIADLVDANLDGLEKAPKAALQAVRDFVANA